MTLVKVNGAPFAKQFNSIFDDWFSEFPALTGKDSNAGFSNVPVNIYENKDGYTLELSAPGLNKDDIKLNVENGLLTISYEKKEETKSEENKTVRKEFSYRSFKRSFNLDDKINVEDISGKYENGVLKLQLPKRPEAKISSKQISIQ
ncbi:MAG: heat-shock protein Hsp20 [Bacteroidetes bacterium]|nr:MAG: heat-shock protein Hsp20 [Bacteroidota bacterium]